MYVYDTSSVRLATILTAQERGGDDDWEEEVEVKIHALEQ